MQKVGTISGVRNDHGAGAGGKESTEMVTRLDDFRAAALGAGDAAVQPAGVEAVTVEEAMQMLGVSRRTIFKYMNDGKLRRMWRAAGSRTVIPVADIKEMYAPRPRRRFDEPR